MPTPQSPSTDQSGDPIPVAGYFLTEFQIRQVARSESLDVWGSLIRRWPWPLIAMITLGLAAFLMASTATPLYRSTVELVFTESDQAAGLAGISDQLGALGSLAGIRVGSDSSRRAATMATLRSDGFAQRFIEHQGIEPELVDEEPGLISRVLGYSLPDMEDSVRRFQQSVKFVSEDDRTGVVRLTIQWEDSLVGAEWANSYIAMLNAEMRDEAIAEAERSISYLEEELSKTNVVGIQQAVFGLIEAQTRAAMIANVRHDFALKVIDEARPTSDPSSPKTLLMIAIGLVFGFAVGWCIALWRDHRVQRSPT